MKHSLRLVVFLLFSVAFLPACGQKGPLFLPGDPSSLQTVPPAGELQDMSDEEDEDQEPEPISNR